MYRVVVTEKHFGTFFLQNFVAEDELEKIVSNDL
ncbi:Uncharacterised protein [Roseburia inulinivorans]|jgi:hypothetical protein|uniref:Uncharacterized protein n=1 Tax=Roseburia inulinivorans TaxID=360807 RepID=A0A173VY80_9FIRM|nr:Uncharacterised protein [Roseburia inulinivorans]